MANGAFFNFNQIINIITIIVILGGGFYFSGRVTFAIESLTAITKDHENRIRILESKNSRNRMGWNKENIDNNE